jgi:hypothetical protein
MTLFNSPDVAHAQPQSEDASCKDNNKDGGTRFIASMIHQDTHYIFNSDKSGPSII